MTCRIEAMITTADRPLPATSQRVVPIAPELLAIAGGNVDAVERDARDLGQ
jgi:hypothetical protein